MITILFLVVEKGLLGSLVSHGLVRLPVFLHGCLQFRRHRYPLGALTRDNIQDRRVGVSQRLKCWVGAVNSDMSRVGASVERDYGLIERPFDMHHESLLQGTELFCIPRRTPLTG